eukprot:10954120-Ditylum_brightwellii.AAC.1
MRMLLIIRQNMLSVVNNVGITHFGAALLLLPQENLRFDTFHLKCDVVWQVITSFNREVLSQFWNDYHLFCLNTKSNFISFQENDLSLFVANTTKIPEYL